MSPPSVGQRRQQDTIGPTSYSKPIGVIPAPALRQEPQRGALCGTSPIPTANLPQRVVGHSRPEQRVGPKGLACFSRVADYSRRSRDRRPSSSACPSRPPVRRRPDRARRTGPLLLRQRLTLCDLRPSGAGFGVPCWSACQVAQWFSSSCPSLRLFC